MNEQNHQKRRTQSEEQLPRPAGPGSEILLGGIEELPHQAAVPAAHRLVQGRPPGGGPHSWPGACGRNGVSTTRFGGLKQKGDRGTLKKRHTLLDLPRMAFLLRSNKNQGSKKEHTHTHTHSLIGSWSTTMLNLKHGVREPWLTFIGVLWESATFVGDNLLQVGRA